MSVRTRAGAAGAALTATVLLVATGPYSPDLLVNLNPPTLVLVTLGVTQLFVFTLLRPALTRLASRPPVARLTGVLAARAMTIYLWHMPAIIALCAVLLVSGIPLPEPLSGAWWQSRPLWLIAVTAVVWATVRIVGSDARHAPTAEGPIAPGPAAFAAGLAVAGVVLLLVTQFTLAGGILAVALLWAGLRLATGRGTR